MSKKHYVVWKGATPGIYDNWPQAKAQIDGRKDAQYMGFPSKEEALKAYAEPYAKAMAARRKEKGGSAAKPAGKRPAKKASSAKPVSNSADINIYSDGACSPNPGKAGTGIAIYQKDEPIELWYGLFDAKGTNNSAELNGLLEAFKLAVLYLKQGKTVQVLSDSKYSIDCITQWAKGWKAKGWTRGSGEPIKNLALIQTCYQYWEQLQSHVSVTYVKGHANIEGNETGRPHGGAGSHRQANRFCALQYTHGHSRHFGHAIRITL